MMFQWMARCRRSSGLASNVGGQLSLPASSRCLRSPFWSPVDVIHRGTTRRGNKKRKAGSSPYCPPPDAKCLPFWNPVDVIPQGPLGVETN